MLRRLIEITLGVALAFCLFASYGIDANSKEVLIWQILSPQTLQIIVWIGLFLLASRLVFGKYKDYSKYFYNLFVKIFGDPKKKVDAK